MKNIFCRMLKNKYSRKIAFTLAEVLVTLGIIGVVAAITMPTLIDNHQKKVAATRLEKFYSMMSQAVYQWVGDTGFIPGTTYNFPENTKYNGKGLEQWYNANLGKYIKSTSQVSTDSGMFVAFADGSGFNAYQTGGNMYFFFCIEAKYCNTKHLLRKVILMEKGHSYLILQTEISMLHFRDNKICLEKNF